MSKGLENTADLYSGKLFLLVGPSGSGKGTVMEEFKRKYKGFVYPVSYTTRAPREGEKNGDVYFFIGKEEFEVMIEEGKFLEYAVVHGEHYYGTVKEEFLAPLRVGAAVMREVDIQGFVSIRDLVPKENLVSIFIKVGGGDEELVARILRRGEMSDEELKKRLESAKKEIAMADDCDYQVENLWGQAMDCVAEVEKIVLDEIEKLG
ncbi:guanylate kinase [Candidatus Peregrinibacteria bacterium HGW-Peregrinibacteria-1]|jgi:guanylate kinase|nr:MAG: guanylate kinase [Candidatus Peregrinibacteria bacterium HGW-Peregrinibacteria-1]